MFRRVVCCVLLVGFVLAQGATLPHAHAHQRPDHNARSHVHFDWLSRLFGHSSRHDPRHVHGAHGHVHHHDGLVAEGVDPADVDHDATCVYLADLDRAVASPVAGAAPVDAGMVHDQAVAATQFVATAPDVRAFSILSHAPPDAAAPSGRLLLAMLRTLRI